MKKVIIIGAGPAGLTAGYELLKKSNDYDVTIFEQSDRIGGISQTVKYKGNRMDIGGHRFFSKDDRVMEWWYNILPSQGAPAKDDIEVGSGKTFVPGGADPEKTDDVMLKRNRVSRIYYKGKFFDYPVSLKWETIKNMGFFTTIKAGFSYLGTVFCKLPETSLENFYINRFGRVLYSMFFEGYTEKLWGRHPKYISADWGSQRVKGLSIRAVIADMFGKIFKSSRKVETSLIEEYIYPKLGPGQLYEKVRDEIVGNGAYIYRRHTMVKGSNIRKEVRFGGIFVWVLLVASFIQFNISYPYLCTADFRYISVTAVAGAVFMAYAMQLTHDTKMCEVLKFLSVAFAVCSAAVYI